MTKVRPVVIPYRTGSVHQIDCAVRTDGSSPAFEFLMELKNKAWPSGVVEAIDPDFKPAAAYYLFISRLKYFASTGHPKEEKAMNYLRYGIWEFKAIALRMAFFDLDPQGNLVRKGKNRDRGKVDPQGTNPFWEYPDFEQLIRLTHGFPKTGTTTDPTEIELAQTIRDEDL